MRFELQYDEDVPTAYIDLFEGRKDEDSKKQIVVGGTDLRYRRE